MSTIYNDFPWAECSCVNCSPLGLDGLCVGHACMLLSCASRTLAFHVLVAFHNVDHGCSKVAMMNLMLILWNASS